MDSRTDVHDVGEAQDVEIAFDVDAAEFTDASQVIAAQVDEHVVFGQFLRIVQEFIFQGLVFFRRLAPRPRAGQGECEEVAVFQAGQRFRRRTGQFDVVTGEEEHVRRRVDGPQDAICIEEAPFGFGAQAVGQDDLENIAFTDVILALFDHLAIFFFIEQGFEIALELQRYVRCLLAFADEAFHALHFQESPIIIFFDRVEADVDDEVNLLFQVIEDDDLVEQHEVEVVEAIVIDGVEFQRRFGVFDEIIGKVADQSACKGRQVRKARCLVIC